MKIKCRAFKSPSAINMFWKIKKKRELTFFVVIEMVNIFRLNFMFTVNNMALSIKNKWLKNNKNCAPCTPQQNGLSKSENRRFVNIVNAIILKSCHLVYGWSILTSCDVYNRITSRNHMYRFTNYRRDETKAGLFKSIERFQIDHPIKRRHVYTKTASTACPAYLPSYQTYKPSNHTTRVSE